MVHNIYVHLRMKVYLVMNDFLPLLYRFVLKALGNIPTEFTLTLVGPCNTIQ
jgi:hypothetical protein